jgi:cation:H+ antiporter
MMDYLWVALGLALLFFGGEFLVKGSVALALKLRISTLVIGLTIVSSATSAPELIVSLNAALNGHSDIALGNVVGSNTANIGLILGLTAFIFRLTVSKDSYRFNWPAMALLSLLLFLFSLDGAIGRWEGLVFLVLVILFNAFIITRSRREGGIESVPLDQKDVDAVKILSPARAFLIIILGTVFLFVGADRLVVGAVNIASSLGISERVIGVSVVSIGTSIPELAASLVAAMRNQKELSIGNILGSNIFNIGAVLGITALISPITQVDAKLLTVDIYTMLAFTLGLFIFMRMKPLNEIVHWQGLLILLSYLLYLYLLFF